MPVHSSKLAGNGQQCALLIFGITGSADGLIGSFDSLVSSVVHSVEIFGHIKEGDIVAQRAAKS